MWDVLLHDLFDMGSESFDVGQVDSFQNVDYDVAEAVVVEVNFLVVGYFAKIAIGNGCQYESGCDVFGFTVEVTVAYLTSPKLAGNSAVIAPPKSDMV